MRDFFSDNRWILPYDLPTICAAIGCNPEDDGDYMFLAPAQSMAPGFPRSYTTTASADWRVPAGRTYSWSGSEVSELRFGVGGRITAKGTFNVSGMSLTAANASQGWLGVRYNAGSGGSLSNVTLARVGSTAPGWAGSAVTIHDASPALTNVFIQDAATAAVSGVTVTGASAAPVLTHLTARDLTGAGVSVAADARVDIVRGEFSENGTGVAAAGTGSVAYLVPDWENGVLRGPSITGNRELGVVASSAAEVRFGAPSPQHGLTTVADNDGRGLTASSGGALYAGTTTVYQRNRIFRNALGNPTGNVLATGSGSRAYANCNWWNTSTPGPADFRAGATSGGLLTLWNYLTADPYLVSNASCDGSSAERMAGSTTTSARAPSASLLAAVESPSPAAALRALVALVADAPESPEAAAALSEIGSRAAAMGPAAQAALEAATTHRVTALRVAAWQALVGLRAARGDVAGALAATDALAAEGATLSAEAARVYLHAVAGDTASARTALTRLEAAAPGSVEAEAARAYLGIGAEPEGTRSALMGFEAASVQASGAPAAAGLRVQPNPATTAASVVLRLETASDVRVTVHDALGRTVATVVDGALEAGEHRAGVATDVLAPGVYVVRAAVGTTVSTARLVVAR